MTAQLANKPLLGRPILNALGLKTSYILAAAADRYNGSIDLSHISHQIDGARIARIYHGVNHSKQNIDANKPK